MRLFLIVHLVPLCLGHDVPLFLLLLFFALIFHLLSELGLESEVIALWIFVNDFGRGRRHAILLPLPLRRLLFPTGAAGHHLVLTNKLLPKLILPFDQILLLECEVAALAWHAPLVGHMLWTFGSGRLSLFLGRLGFLLFKSLLLTSR